MDDVTWVPLMEYWFASGAFCSVVQLMDGAQLDMLRVEGELLAARIPAVFFPHRPGDLFTTKADDPCIRLMVHEGDLSRAQLVRDEVLGTEV